MKDIPFWPRLLGLAGLLPQFICLLYILDDGDWKFAALAMANAYCVMIFSFLGGLWWGLAAGAQGQGRSVPDWIYLASVAPSLMALASFLPWVVGEIWPGPSMIVIGAGLLFSPIVDRAISLAGFAPFWWMKLRIILSTGLGIMTIAAGIAAI